MKGLSPRQRASWLAHLFKAATKQHHKELRALFAPLIPADAVVIDVGAHGGQFTKLFARMAPRGHVYAFEPSAYARSILLPALAFNRLSNVSVLPAGLADRPGGAVLHTPLKRSTALGFGVAHLGASESTGDFDQTIALTTLDEFATRETLPRLDFIKADIEGWEMRALIGGEVTLRRFQPGLYLEVDDALLARAGDTPGGLFKWLTGLGYRAFATPDLTPVADWTGPGDYLFTATEKARRPSPHPLYRVRRIRIGSADMADFSDVPAGLVENSAQPPAKCQICGEVGAFARWRTREMLHGTREAFDYVECPSCGCVQIADIPGDLSRFYPGDYFSFRSLRSLDRNPVRRFIDPRRVRSRFGEREFLGSIAERISRPFDYVSWVKDAGLGADARVLDVGCGAGKTLLNMALGGFPRPDGVDPFVRETLRYDCGVTVHEESLDAFARDRPSRYDLIMFHNSLEHMVHPLAALRLAGRMLTPGGRILVAVPVANSWAWRNYRENWFALDPPRHIHLLTTPAMTILARNAGLDVLHCRSTSNLSQFTASERYRRDIPTNDKRRDRELFTRRDLAAWRRHAKELETMDLGDQTMFILAAEKA